MPNLRNKSVDTTYLSLDKAEERGFIHRDYIAHCLRWSHVVKKVTPIREKARVLDVGCGRELPLAKTLYTMRLIVKEYVGVDAGPVEDEAIATFLTGKFPIQIREKTDVCTLDIEPRFNVITCFEVFEHVEPEHGVRLLKKLKACLDPNDPDARIYLSTPCFDPKMGAAANHVNEMTYGALGSMIQSLNLCVENVWGTFASIKDYKKEIEEDAALTVIFNKMREYYDVNYLATIFAPLFPQHSRNCLWELSNWVKAGKGAITFPELGECGTPWGQAEPHLYAKALETLRAQ